MSAGHTSTSYNTQSQHSDGQNRTRRRHFTTLILTILNRNIVQCVSVRLRSRCVSVRLGASRCVLVRLGALRCASVRLGALRCASVRLGAPRCASVDRYVTISPLAEDSTCGCASVRVRVVVCGESKSQLRSTVVCAGIAQTYDMMYRLHVSYMYM